MRAPKRKARSQKKEPPKRRDKTKLLGAGLFKSLSLLRPDFNFRPKGTSPSTLQIGQHSSHYDIPQVVLRVFNKLSAAAFTSVVLKPTWVGPPDNSREDQKGVPPPSSSPPEGLFVKDGMISQDDPSLDPIQAHVDPDADTAGQRRNDKLMLPISLIYNPQQTKSPSISSSSQHRSLVLTYSLQHVHRLARRAHSTQQAPDGDRLGDGKKPSQNDNNNPNKPQESSNTPPIDEAPLDSMGRIRKLAQEVQGMKRFRTRYAAQFERKFRETTALFQETIADIRHGKFRLKTPFRRGDGGADAKEKPANQMPNPIIALYTISRWKLSDHRQNLTENAKQIEKQVDVGDYSSLKDLTRAKKNYQIRHIEGIYSMVTPQDYVLNALRILRRALILAQVRGVGPFADLFQGKPGFNPMGERIDEYIRLLPTKTPNSTVDTDLRVYIDILMHFKNPPGVPLDPDLARLQRQAYFIRMDLNFPDIIFTIDLYERIRHHITEVSYAKYIATPNADVEAHYTIFENLIRFRLSKAYEQFSMLYFESKYRLETQKSRFHADQEAVGLRNELRRLEAKAKHPTREDLEYERKIREREKEMRTKYMDKLDFALNYDQRPRFKVRHTREKYIENIKRAGEEEIRVEVEKMTRDLHRQKKIRYQRQRQEILQKYGVHDTSQKVLEIERYRGGSLFNIRVKMIAELFADTFFLYSNKLRRVRNARRWDAARKRIIVHELYRNQYPIREGKYPPANAKYLLTRKYYEKFDPYVNYFGRHMLGSRFYDVTRVYLPYLSRYTGMALSAVRMSPVVAQQVNELSFRGKVNRLYTKETRQFKWDNLRDSRLNLQTRLRTSVVKLTAPVVVPLGEKIKPLGEFLQKTQVTPPPEITPLVTHAALDHIKHRQEQQQQPQQQQQQEQTQQQQQQEQQLQQISIDSKQQISPDTKQQISTDTKQEQKATPSPSPPPSKEEEKPAYTQVRSSLVWENSLTSAPRPIPFPERPPSPVKQLSTFLTRIIRPSQAKKMLMQAQLFLTNPIRKRLRVQYLKLKHSQRVEDYLMVLEPITQSKNIPKALVRHRRLVYAVMKHLTMQAPGGRHVVKAVEYVNKLPPVVFASWAAKRIGKGVIRATSRAFTFQERMLSRNYTPTMRKQYMDSSTKATRVEEQAIRAYLLLKAYGILCLRVTKVAVTLPVALAYVQITRKVAPHRYSDRAQNYIHAAKQELTKAHFQRAFKKTLDMLTNRFNTAKSRAIFASRHRVRLVRNGFDPILHNHFVPPHIRIISAFYMLFRGAAAPAKDMMHSALLLLLLIMLLSAIAEYIQRKFGGDRIGRLIGQSTEIFLNAAVWHILFSHGLATASDPEASRYEKEVADGEMIMALHHVMDIAWARREENQLKLLKMGIDLPERVHHHPFLDSFKSLVVGKFHRSVFGSPIDHFEDRVLDPMKQIYYQVFEGKQYQRIIPIENLKRALLHNATPEEIGQMRSKPMSFDKLRIFIHLLSNPSTYFNPAMLYSPVIDDPDDPHQVYEYLKEMQDPELNKLHILDDEWWVRLPSWFTQPYTQHDNYSPPVGDLQHRLMEAPKAVNRGRKHRPRGGAEALAELQRDYGYGLTPPHYDDVDYNDEDDYILDWLDDDFAEYDQVFGQKPWLDDGDHDAELVPSMIKNRVIKPGEEAPPIRYFKQYPDLSEPHEMFPYATRVLRDTGYLDPTNEERKLSRNDLIRVEGLLREKAAQYAERSSDKDQFKNPYLDKADQVRSRIAVLDFLEANDIKIINGVAYIGVDPLASYEDERSRLFGFGDAAMQNVTPFYDEEEDQMITLDIDDAGHRVHEFYDRFYEHLPKDKLKEHTRDMDLLDDIRADVLEDFHDDRIAHFSDGVGLAPPIARDDWFYDPESDRYYHPEDHPGSHDDSEISQRKRDIYHIRKKHRKTYVPMATNGYYADMFRVKLGMWLRDYHHGVDRATPFWRKPQGTDDPAYEIWKWNQMPIRLMRNNGNYEYPRRWVDFRDAMRQLLVRDYPFFPVVDPAKVSVCVPHPDEWEGQQLKPNEFYKADFINIIRQLDERYYGKKYIGDPDLFKIFFEFARSRVMNMVTVQDEQFLLLLDEIIYSNYLDPLQYETLFQTRFDEAFETLIHNSPIFKESAMMDPGDVLRIPHNLPTERIKRLMNTPAEELTPFDVDDGQYVVALFDDYSKYLGDAIRDGYMMDQYHYRHGRLDFLSGIGLKFTPEEIENQIKYLDLLAQHFPTLLPSPAHMGQSMEERPLDLQMVQSIIATNHYRKFGRPYPAVWWDPAIVPKDRVIRPSDTGFYGDSHFSTRRQMTEEFHDYHNRKRENFKVESTLENYPLKMTFEDYIKTIKEENGIPEFVELSEDQMQYLTDAYHNNGALLGPVGEDKLEYYDSSLHEGPYNLYHMDQPFLNMDATVYQQESATAHSPNWYERLGMDEDHIVKRAYVHFYGDIQFDPIKGDRPPRWSNLDVNPAVIREFMNLTYPNEEEFNIHLRRKYSAKWHEARKFFGFVEFRKYSRLLHEQWKKDVTAFKKVKKAYDELYWDGPGDDFDEALKLDQESSDWYFKDYHDGRFGDRFIQPYWSKERIKDFRRRIYLAERGKWEFKRFSERVYQDYHKKMNELEETLDHKVYYLLPEEEQDMVHMTEKALLAHQTPPIEWGSLPPEMVKELQTDRQPSHAVGHRMEWNRFLALSRGHEFYLSRYGEDIWYRRQMVRHWTKLFLKAFDRADLPRPTDDLVRKALLTGDLSLLPPLPVTQYVGDLDDSGNPTINEFDLPFFNEWAILDLPRTKEQHETFDKEVITSLWEKVLELSKTADTGRKSHYDDSDFEWKNRGIEMALILVHIGEARDMINQMQTSFRETTAEYNQFLENPEQYEDPEAASTYYTEVLAKIKDEIDNKTISIQHLEEQYQLYRPENLAMYSYYLSTLKKPDLLKEFGYFDAIIRDDPTLVTRFGSVSLERILNRTNDRELKTVGSSEYRITTPELLEKQVEKYLRTGEKFYLVFYDVLPNTMSRIEPKFVRNALGRWVVDIPLGLQFVENELTAVAPSARVAADLQFTLESLHRRGSIVNINEFNQQQRETRLLRQRQIESISRPNIVAPQPRPNIFSEEHYDMSYQHEHMVNAMEFYDMQYFRTLCMLGLIQSGKKYMVPVPGKNWAKVKERLRTFFTQNYTLFAYMYFRNFSISQVPGEILFYLEEYYRMHNFDRMLFRGKPLHYAPIDSLFEVEKAKEFNRLKQVKQNLVHISRQIDREQLKDKLMDEIANFPDVVLSGSRPIYSTPIHGFELAGDVLSLGTEIDLNPKFRKIDDEAEEKHTRKLRAISYSTEMQQALQLGRFPLIDKEHPDEEAHRQRFYDELEFRHGLSRPYTYPDQHLKRDYVAPVSVVRNNNSYF